MTRAITCREITPIPKPAKRGPKPRTRIARKAKPKQQSQSPRAKATRAADAAVRRLLRLRSGGVCEFCLAAPATDAAHGLGKKAHPALRHMAWNNAHLCRNCHARYGEWATAAGLRKLQAADPPGLAWFRVRQILRKAVEAARAGK